jgi:hypothetical protein
MLIATSTATLSIDLVGRAMESMIQGDSTAAINIMGSFSP